MERGINYRPAQDCAGNADIGMGSSYFDKRLSGTPCCKDELVYRIQKEVDDAIEAPFKDISYGLAQGLAETVYNAANEEPFPTRRAALDYFDKRHFEKGLVKAKGNITQFVRDAFGTDDPARINNLRKNVYRKIGRHGLTDLVDGARPWKEKQLDTLYDRPKIEATAVESTLSNALSNYSPLLRENVYADLSTQIKEKAPLLADRISSYIPSQANRLDSMMRSTEGINNYHEAKAVFEKQLIYDALISADFDKTKAAGYLGDSVRTLNRRIEQLGLDVEAIRQGDEVKDANDGKVISIESAVRKKEEEKPRAVSEIERFKQLVAEYNAKREIDRQRKRPAVKTQRKFRLAA